MTDLPPLKVSVEVPQPINLHGKYGGQRLAVTLAGHEWVEIDHTGTVSLHHGGKVLCSVNIVEAWKAATAASTTDG